MCRSMNLTAAIVFALILASSSSLRGQEAEEGESLTLTGKVVLAQMANKPWYYVLENARIVEIGGKTMLVGKFVPTGTTAAHTWTKGLPFGVSWDVVQTVIVFESVEDYRERSSTMISTYAPSRGNVQTLRSDLVPQLNEDEIRNSESPANPTTPRSPNP